MMKHLQRAGEVIALYRRCLEVARLFPDPCGRNYLHYYVVEKFRKRSTETSPTTSADTSSRGGTRCVGSGGRCTRDGTISRSSSFSVRTQGPIQAPAEGGGDRGEPATQAREAAEVEAEAPPGASGETFTLASLERFLDPSTREATGAAAAEREATEASARL